MTKLATQTLIATLLMGILSATPALAAAGSGPTQRTDSLPRIGSVVATDGAILHFDFSGTLTPDQMSRVIQIELARVFLTGPSGP